MNSSVFVPRPRFGRNRVRATIAALAVLAVLAVPATALASAFSVKATFPKSNPVAGKTWPITLKVTKGRQKLSGSVSYKFVIPNIYTTTRKGHSFKGGVYHDKLSFPSQATGIAIHLYVVVKTKDGTVSVEHTVTPQS